MLCRNWPVNNISLNLPVYPGPIITNILANGLKIIVPPTVSPKSLMKDHKREKRVSCQLPNSVALHGGNQIVDS